MRRDFYPGQRILWYTSDFEGEHCTRAVVTEVYLDHVIARTEGNDCRAYDNMNLWIDEHNEMDFFDESIAKSNF